MTVRRVFDYHRHSLLQDVQIRLTVATDKPLDGETMKRAQKLQKDHLPMFHDMAHRDR